MAEGGQERRASELRHHATGMDGLGRRRDSFAIMTTGRRVVRHRLVRVLRLDLHELAPGS